MIQTFEISENEKKIVEQLRNLKPFETISITADAQGRPDSFLLTRTAKMLLITNQKPVFTKARFHLQD